MLLDRFGEQITPIWYDRGSGIVTVRYADGREASLSVHDITSPQGAGYVASVIRTVRVP